MATKIERELKHDILMYLVKRGSLRDKEAQALRDRLRPKKRGRKKGWRKKNKVSLDEAIRVINEYGGIPQNNT